MLRDIYEWLLDVKKIEPRTIQAIRDFERKHKCTPYTAIEKMEVCSVSEIKEGITAVFNVRPLNRDIADLQTSSFVSLDDMRSLGFIAMFDPTKKVPAEEVITLILIFDPRNRVPATDAFKRSGASGKVAVRWITEEQYEYWKKMTSKSFGHSSFKNLSHSIESVASMGDVELSTGEDVVESGSDDQKIVELANSIIDRAIQVGASDIHIESFSQGCRIRYRVDGVLSVFNVIEDKSVVRRLINRFKVVGRMDVNNSRTPQSGKIAFAGHDIRVSTLPAIEGEKVVLRILNSQQGSIRNLQELGFGGQFESLLRKMFTRPYGIVLVSGPTGSGKSSTLAAILDELNTEDVCMVTIEDPVEYRLGGVTQVNVNPAAGLTFANVLRETLRQDPNIIMVGEIRDKETADISMQASNTGHLVFSTIHTNSALSVITRLNDMGIDGYLVADNIVGIVSQSLVRKLCPHCKKQHIITEDDVKKYYAPKSLIGKTDYIAGEGCDRCNGTGYSGRTVAFEILEITPEISNAMHSKLSINEIGKIAAKHGFVKKLDYAYDLVLNGVTTLHEVSRVIGGINSEKVDN